jgi:hypothetical protein
VWHYCCLTVGITGLSVALLALGWGRLDWLKLRRIAEGIISPVVLFYSWRVT